MMSFLTRLNVILFVALIGQQSQAAWVFCANEDGTCKVPGTKQVRYGTKSKFNYRTVTTSTPCTNAVFGDPIPGYDKKCEYDDASSTTNANCTFNGATVNHLASVTAYVASSVAYGSTCQSQTRTCNNGVLSGTAQYSSCSVAAAANCSFNGATVNHSASITAYVASSVAYGSTCQSQTRTCNNGVLSGTAQYGSCSVAAAANCSFNGATVNHASSVTAYVASSVPAGSSCQSEVRSCNNGVLSGSAQYSSCTVGSAPPANCTFNGATVNHLASVTAYVASSVAYGSTCQSQTRTCNNGVLSGTAQYGSCSVAAPANCTFNGATVNHAASVTAYVASSVPAGSSCQSEVRSCSNGVLSGSAQYSSCTVSSTPPSTGMGNPKSTARIFISGHSLTDNPLGEFITTIATGLGLSSQYQQQIELGSPIRYRTRGPDSNGTSWEGYNIGSNRVGGAINVLSELSNPQTVSGGKYDTLIITERHDLLGSLQWENTVRYLRHYHERFIAANPAGQSYFYEAWYDVDKTNPIPWINHERQASTVWKCIATRVNESLATEGRSDRILSTPTGAALAELVEKATQGNVNGVTGVSVNDTLNKIFADNVHMTSLGAYYMSLVNFIAVHRQSPVGSAAPAASGVSAAAAASLQNIAWQYMSNYYANPPAQLSLAQCREFVRANFCATYWNYRNTPSNVADCQDFFTRTTSENPLFYNSSTNSSYWFPAP